MTTHTAARNLSQMLDQAVHEEASRRNVSLMHVRPWVNQDAICYRAKGRPLEFGGLELLQNGNDEESMRQLVLRKFYDAFKAAP